jgi:ABC-type branched-subunit amino acid transport system ATPase component
MATTNGANGAAMLKIKGLEVSYGGIHAVKGVDLEVGKGELVTLIGANGAGKTTTMKAIAGLKAYSAARIVVPEPRAHARADRRRAIAELRLRAFRKTGFS